MPEKVISSPGASSRKGLASLQFAKVALLAPAGGSSGHHDSRRVPLKSIVSGCAPDHSTCPDSPCNLRPPLSPFLIVQETTKKSSSGMAPSPRGQLNERESLIRK